MLRNTRSGLGLDVSKGEHRMKTELHNLSIDERLRLVEDIWDSIAADQGTLPLTDEQKAELDQRLDIYELDKNVGRVAAEVIADIKKKL